MSIKSVDKAIQILFTFSAEERLLGVSEISAKLGMNASTVHHLAATLKQYGLLEQDPSSRKYRLGMRLIELGGTMLQGRNLARSIQPYLYHVATEVEETAYMGVLVGGDLLNVEQVCGPQRIQYAGWQGRRTPFYCTSAGKVLAAYMPDQELEQLIAEHPLQRFTPNTITDPHELREHLLQVRAQGYGISIGEMSLTINALAVPIKGLGNDNGQVIASIGVIGPAYRFTQAKCEAQIAFLQSVGQEISSRFSADNVRYLNTE
ncbi:MAG: IclR family transcriptional regulator [Anaerolineae bacterium]|nr:IclR family transcriptional regulator [Anaerolineae bacterium]